VVQAVEAVEAAALASHAPPFTGEHGLPPQQFSVRKPINEFIVSKFAA
jgi:hypothetical protein